MGDLLQTVLMYAVLSIPIVFGLQGMLFLVVPRRLPWLAAWMRRRWRHPRLVALFEVWLAFDWAALLVYSYGAYAFGWLATILGHGVGGYLFYSALIPILLVSLVDRRYAIR
jgi:hypothetical protein